MYRATLIILTLLFCSISNGDGINSFPPAVASYEEWAVLKSPKSSVKGFNLPHFGTSPHTIFFNSANDAVTLNVMFSATKPQKTKSLWYLMITDYENPGRHSSCTYDEELRSRIEKYLNKEALSDKTLIYEMGDIHWVTLRLNIPSKYGLFAVPYPEWAEPLCEPTKTAAQLLANSLAEEVAKITGESVDRSTPKTCKTEKVNLRACVKFGGANEDPNPDIWQLRHWLLSLETK